MLFLLCFGLYISHFKLDFYCLFLGFCPWDSHFEDQTGARPGLRFIPVFVVHITNFHIKRRWKTVNNMIGMYMEGYDC